MKYEIDDLLVDTGLRRVTRNGTRIDLPETSWRVFAALIERAPDTVSYDALAALAWRQEP